MVYFRLSTNLSQRTGLYAFTLKFLKATREVLKFQMLIVIESQVMVLTVKII